MTVRGYLLGIDWANSGDPAATGEDDTSDVKKDDLVVSWGRETTQAATLPAAGTFGVVLNNDSRKYSPENVSSPLAGLIQGGRRVQLQHTLSGATVKFVDGVLDSFVADSTAKTFTGSCLDAWGRPGGESLSTAVYRGLRTGDAVGIILDAIGWEGARNIDPGVTVMPWWWEDGTDAATAIEKLVNSEGPPALAYVRAGVFVFEDRHHRLLTAASQTTNGLYTYIIPAGSGPGGDFKMGKDTITYDHGLARIVNSVTFLVGERRPGGAGEVWSMDGPITIGAGGTVTLFPATTDPFINARTPADGVDITSDTGNVTATLSRDSGVSTILTLTASSATVVSRVALTAVSVPVARQWKVTSEDTSSVNTRGRQTWPTDAPWANRYDAQAIADRIVATYATNRPVMTFEIAGVLDPTYMAQIRARQISDRITVRDDQLGVNRDFIIEKIQHTIHQLSDHRMQLTCEVPEPTQPANVFTFDLAGHGFDDGIFGVSGIDSAVNVFQFDVAGHGFDQAVFAT